MKIVFNLNGVGLGNNGGSRTVIKSAETLASLGHTVYLFSPANKYTWHKIQVPVVSAYPKQVDAVIATGYRSAEDTVRRKAEKKFYYVRGFETWNASEERLFQSYRSLKCIVNSEWLQACLRKRGIPSHLVYQGLDFDEFGYESRAEPVIGGLFHTRHATKRSNDVLEIGKRLGCKVLMLNRDIKNPNRDKLRTFYNQIRVWITPSELEGLHNCPMEAAMCGAGIVGTDHRRSGTSDYLLHEKTGLVYPARNLDVACDYVKTMLTDNALFDSLRDGMASVLRSKIGSRKRNMKRLANILRTA